MYVRRAEPELRLCSWRRAWSLDAVFASMSTVTNEAPHTISNSFRNSYKYLHRHVHRLQRTYSTCQLHSLFRPLRSASRRVAAVACGTTIAAVRGQYLFHTYFIVIFNDVLGFKRNATVRRSELR